MKNKMMEQYEKLADASAMLINRLDATPEIFHNKIYDKECQAICDALVALREIKEKGETQFYLAIHSHGHGKDYKLLSFDPSDEDLKTLFDYDEGEHFDVLPMTLES